MKPAASISRRSLLGEVGLVAAGIGLGAMARDASAAEIQDRPRLPLRIFARFGLKDTSAEQIQSISPQITLIRDESNWRDELSKVDVVFGGLSADELAAAKQLRWVQFPSAGVE